MVLKYLIEVIKQAHAKKMPILGICRGLQILNVAFGGNLFQDISLGGKNVTRLFWYWYLLQNSKRY